MYRRIRRTEEDNFPDIIRRAVRNLHAPKVQQATDQHLSIVYLSDHQLQAFRNELVNRLDRQMPEAAELITELGRCSAMLVVFTTAELLLVSNRSPDRFRPLMGEYSKLVQCHDAFSRQCASFILGLEQVHQRDKQEDRTR
jgi:hypothetical protein